MWIFVTVIAYSDQGVFVGVANSYADTVLDMNTRTGRISEISHHVTIDERCNYHLSFQELERCKEFFISLLN